MQKILIAAAAAAAEAASCHVVFCLFVDIVRCLYIFLYSYMLNSSIVQNVEVLVIVVAL